MSNDQVFGGIKENYTILEKALSAKLWVKNDNHHLTAGVYREDIWKEYFEKMFPQKFSIEQGIFIVSSAGEVSKEVDLVVFDKQYTPYIFQEGGMKYIPIEAVAAVVQCKGQTLKVKELKEWCASINNLTTNNTGLARIAQGISQIELASNRETRPIRILCSLNKAKSHQYIGENLFDFAISAPNGHEGLHCFLEDKTLAAWCERLNGEEYKGCNTEINKNVNDYFIGNAIKVGACYTLKNNATLSMVFLLNQLLMLINNPMLFPHLAYVGLFAGKNKDTTKKGDENA